MSPKRRLKIPYSNITLVLSSDRFEQPQDADLFLRAVANEDDREMVNFMTPEDKVQIANDLLAEMSGANATGTLH